MTLARLVYGCGVCLLVLFAVPFYSHTFHDDMLVKEATTVWKVGMPNSPWLRYESLAINESQVSSSIDFQLVSWSWPALIVGVTLMAVSQKPPNPKRVKKLPVEHAT